MHHQSKNKPKHTQPNPMTALVTLEQKVNVIEWCLQQRQQYWTKYKGRLPHKVGQEAAQHLGMTYRSVKFYIDRAITAVELLTKEEQGNQQKVRATIEAVLVTRPRGRKKDPRLTEEQEQVAVFGYLNRFWIAVLGGEHPKKVTIAPTFELVYRLLLYIWPDLNISLAYLRRFLNQHIQKSAAKYALAREGRRIFWQEYILRKTNNAIAINNRWIIDARPLPIYIRYKDTICTCTLLVIQDDLSRYALRWVVLPRKIVDINGAIKKVDFTSDHARALLVSALLFSGVRPELVYSDHGVQFESWDQLLESLTDALDQPIIAQFSRQSRPQGRGKIEILQALVDAGLLGSYGFVRDDTKEGWREKWVEINNSPEKLDTLNMIQKAVNNYFNKKWNLTVQSSGKTRKQLWESGRSTSLPAPNWLRLALFGYGKMVVAPVRKKGIYYRNRFYHPISDNGYVRISQRMNQKVPLCIIPIDTEECLAFAQLENDMEQVVPEDTKPILVRDHVNHQNSVPRILMGDVHADEQKLMSILKEKFGGHGLPAFERGSNEIVGIGAEVPLDRRTQRSNTQDIIIDQLFMQHENTSHNPIDHKDELTEQAQVEEGTGQPLTLTAHDEQTSDEISFQQHFQELWSQRNASKE